MALPFTFTKYILRQKEEELWKLKYFHHAKRIYNLHQKNPLKQTQILQNIIITL
jgi:hypothetical protein